MVTDPVCQMSLDPKQAAAMQEYQSQTYYFCSTGCKDKFVQQPGTYLHTAPGMHITVGVMDSTHSDQSQIADRVLWLGDGTLRDRKSEQHSFVVDPVCGMRVDDWNTTISTEHMGKKYVFCSSRCRNRFSVEPERYLMEEA